MRSPLSAWLHKKAMQNSMRNSSSRRLPQKDMRVTNSPHSIDPLVGCSRHPKMSACARDAQGKGLLSQCWQRPQR